jgi:multidrug transporter EmrE-like cation transporter
LGNLDEACRRLHAPWREHSLAAIARRLCVPAWPALQALEVGVADAVWTGIGAVGTLVMGVVLFAEALSGMKVAGIVLVMMAITVLRLA